MEAYFYGKKEIPREITNYYMREGRWVWIYRRR